MPEPVVHPVEDVHHRLQTPAPAAHPVSNEEVADAIRIALWNAGLTHHELVVEVSDDCVVLSGTVPAPLHLPELLAATAGLLGARRIEARATVAGAPPPVPEPESLPGAMLPPRPMLSVLRYCTLDAPSLAAAIRSAVRILDAYAAERGVRCGQTVLVYRNVRGATATVETGYLVEPAVLATEHPEVRAGLAPSGPFLAAELMGGVEDLIAGLERLRRESRERGLGEPSVYWQVFDRPPGLGTVLSASRLYAGWDAAPR